MYYIYEIKNNLYHKKYIGITSNYKKRFSQHKCMLENKKHPCKEMQIDYSISRNRCKKFMEYNVIYCTDNKEFASDLEYLFLYKSLVKNEKLYNEKQIWFPSFITRIISLTPFSSHHLGTSGLMAKATSRARWVVM